MLSNSAEVMRTLSSSCPKVVLDENANRGFCSSRVLKLNKLDTSFLPSKGLVNVGLLRLTCVKHQIMHPVSTSVLPESQVDLESSDAPNQETDQLKTVRVKIQLQKECCFGEEFVIVGDDPMFGLWDPENAIPSSWSDEHVWTVELDIPVGKSIQFKFILKEITGTLLWQPGQNRTLQTWETENTIVVSEDWEVPALQKVIEAEPTASSEILVTQNLEHPVEKSASNSNGGTVTPDVNDSLAKNATLPTDERPITVTSVVPPQEKPSTIVADELSEQEKPSTIVADELSQQEKPSTIVADELSQQEKPSTIVADELSQQEKPFTVAADNLSQPEKPSTIVADSLSQPEKPSTIVADRLFQPEKPSNIVADNITNQALNSAARDPTVVNCDSVDVQEDMITHEEEPVLFPGLPPISAIADNTMKGDESEGSTAFYASVEGNKVEDNNFPELEEKHETDGGPNQEETIVGFNVEVKLDNELEHKLQTREERHQDESKEEQSNVLGNDMEWGRRTLQKILTNLGFLSDREVA